VKDLAAIVGKFNPLHRGHINTINIMIEKYGINNCLLLIGSANSHIFDESMFWFKYQERRKIIQREFPKLRVAPLADMNDLDIWITSLWDQITLWKKNATPIDVTFYGGEMTDLLMYTSYKFQYDIVDRNELGISATDIRDRLHRNEKISHLVGAKSFELIMKYWEKAKRDDYEMNLCKQCKFMKTSGSLVTRCYHPNNDEPHFVELTDNITPYWCESAIDQLEDDITQIFAKMTRATNIKDVQGFHEEITRIREEITERRNS